MSLTSPIYSAIMTEATQHHPHQQCGISPTQDCTEGSTLFTLPMKSKSSSYSKKNARSIQPTQAYCCSPSSSDELRQMVSSVTQIDASDDSGREHDDADEELFVLMAPIEENQENNPPPSRIPLLKPRPLRAMQPRPLKMRIELNRSEELFNAPPVLGTQLKAKVGTQLKARAVYLDADASAPKAPMTTMLLEEDNSHPSSHLPRVSLKRVHSSTNIFEDVTCSSTINREHTNMVLQHSNQKKQMAISSSHLFLSIPEERVRPSSIFFPNALSPPSFDDFLATRTPNSGILCLNF